MPTDTCTPSSVQARNFALRAVAWSVGLFGLLRLPAVEQAALLPLTQWQGSLAAGLFGTPILPIQVTLACSGSDAMALCAGFILGYPAAWRARLLALTGGIAMILALNTLRIGTLGRATSPAWFDALHLYIWPAVLILAIAAYVFTWMRRTAVPLPAPAFAAGRTADAAPQPMRIRPAFVMWSAALLVLFTAAAPLYRESAGVVVVAGFMARAAADLLSLVGVHAVAAANVLYTGRGGFIVTQECISTPLIPIYLAGVIAYAGSWRRRTALLLAAVPLFLALGVVRLMVVALPAALADAPLVLVHAFYQLLLAAVLVGLAAIWRHGAGRAAWRHAAAGTAIGAVGLAFLWPLSAPLLAATVPSIVPAGDPQGALALLPAFQLALYGALCVGSLGLLQSGRWRLCAAGLAVLCLSQVAGFAVLDLLQRQADIALPVRELRAWALGAPLLLVLAMVQYDRPRR